MSIETQTPLPGAAGARDADRCPVESALERAAGGRRVRRVDHRRWWLAAALLFAVRALTVLVVGEVGVAGLGASPGGGSPSLVPGSRSLFFNFSHWDAVRYVDIALHATGAQLLYFHGLWFT